MTDIRLVPMTRRAMHAMANALNMEAKIFETLTAPGATAKVIESRTMAAQLVDLFNTGIVCGNARPVVRTRLDADTDSTLAMPPAVPADAHPPRPDLGPDDHMEWGGFIIKRKKDIRGWEHRNAAYVVTERGCNPMPGATFFSSVADAQKGIAALELARRIAPKDDGDRCDGDVFWMLLQLTGMRD